MSNSSEAAKANRGATVGTKRKLIGVQFIRDVRVFGIPRSSIGSTVDGIHLFYDDESGSLQVARDDDGAVEEVMPSAIAVLSWRHSE